MKKKKRAIPSKKRKDWLDYTATYAALNKLNCPCRIRVVVGWYTEWLKDRPCANQWRSGSSLCMTVRDWILIIITQWSSYFRKASSIMIYTKIEKKILTIFELLVYLTCSFFIVSFCKLLCSITQWVSGWFIFNLHF